jgi:PAS domain S-box-containing protein
MEALFGYSKEEIEGRVKWPELVVKDDLERMMEYHRLRRVDLEAAPKSYEFQFIHKTGDRRDASLTATLIPGTKQSVVSIRDITEKKRLEEELQRSEVLYRTFFEVTNAPTVILDEDGTFYRVNREGEKISGFTKEELEGKKSWTEFIAREEDLEKMKEIHRLRRDDPDSAPNHYEFLFKDRYGNLRNIYVAAAMIPGTKRSAVSFMDVTERKRAEEALQESEKWYRTLIRSSSDIVFVLDEARIVCYMSPSVERILGYKPEDMVDKNGFSYYHPDDIPALHAAFVNVTQYAAGTATAVSRALHKNGSVVYLEVVGTNLLDDPQIRGVVGNCRDITERIIAEKALEESEERFHSLFDNLTVGIAMIDTKCQVLAVNKTACRFLDYSQEELIGTQLTALIYPKDLEADREPFKPVIEGKKDHCLMDKRHVRKDGEIVWGRLHVSGIKDEEGHVKFMSVICEDITACKLVEEALVSKSVEMASVVAKCKHMKEALQRSETKYKEIADFLPDLIYKSILLDA